jgi:hypothetical protein
MPAINAPQVFDQFQKISPYDFDILKNKVEGNYVLTQKAVNDAIKTLADKALIKPEGKHIEVETMYSKVTKFFRHFFGFKTSRYEATQYKKALDNMKTLVAKEQERLGEAILKHGELSPEDKQAMQKTDYASAIMNKIVTKINTQHAKDEGWIKLTPILPLKDPEDLAVSALNKKITDFYTAERRKNHQVEENYKFALNIIKNLRPGKLQIMDASEKIELSMKYASGGLGRIEAIKPHKKPVPPPKAPPRKPQQNVKNK